MKLHKLLIGAFFGLVLSLGGVWLNEADAGLKATAAANPAAVAITGGTIDGTVIGGTTPAAGTFTTLGATGVASFADGTVCSAPSISFTTQAGTGFAYQATGNIRVCSSGTEISRLTSTGMTTTGSLGMGASLAAIDAMIARAASNSVQFAVTATAGAATARTELNKSVTGIANAAATDVLTITIPNAAHSASLLTRVTCSLGAGGAIGANEATATNTYIIALTRTAGVNATAAISAASGAAATAVAGAATVTATAAMSSVTGAVGASNSFTVQATVSRSGGSSTNHTCLVYAQLMNANATGITIL